jgi:hypothetical protein
MSEKLLDFQFATDNQRRRFRFQRFGLRHCLIDVLDISDAVIEAALADAAVMPVRKRSSNAAHLGIGLVGSDPCFLHWACSVY